MSNNLFGQLVGIVIPVVALVAVFTFVAVASWSENRRKEREAFYRHETYRKVLEHSGNSQEAVLELMRQEQARDSRKRIEGLRLGGMITTATGAGMMIFLFFLTSEPVFWVGLMPLLIGLVLVGYGFSRRLPEV